MIDGNKVPDLKNYKLKAVIKGDQKIPSISAASIIAKVSRDKFITRLAKTIKVMVGIKILAMEPNNI